VIGAAEVHPVLAFIASAGVLVLGVGYAVGQWRAGSARACAEALQAATAELEVSHRARERLEREVATAKAEIARLQGIVEQLREENATLRSLVMGEQVPQALVTVIEQAAANTRRAIDARLDVLVGEYLDPIRTAVERRE